MLIDSHCHLDFPQYKEKLNEVIENALKSDISYMLAICTKLQDFDNIYKIAEKYPNISCTIGVHPHEAEKHSIAEISKMEDKFTLDKLVGIGETGLDYFYENSARTKQKSSFIKHINLAQKSQLPLIIHTRSAENDTADILKQEKQNADFNAVMHCFTSSYELAKKSLDLGFYISISGIVTFKKADDLRELVKKIPLDRLLVETDSPYLAPVPKRGSVNEPANTKLTALFLANLLNIDYEKFANITTNNFYKLFNKVKN